MDMPATPRAILIATPAGEVKFAAGGLPADDVAQPLLDKWRGMRGAGQTSGLFAVSTGGADFTAVWTSTADAVVFVLFASAQRDVLFEFATAVDFAAHIFRLLLAGRYEGLVVVDKDARVRFISPEQERHLGQPSGTGLGRPVAEVFRTSRLADVVRTGRPELGQVELVKGAPGVVTRKPVLGDDGQIVGAIGHFMFKAPEHMQAWSAEFGRLKSEVSFYQKELSRLQPRAQGLDRIVGQSEAIRRLKEQICRVAPLDVPVLLVGESGTGKELVAQAIHLLSKRRDQSMVSVNSAALPASLIESELFGYEAGAFTGAERKGRRGKIEQADASTLFLDEIGEMAAPVQAKLLRVFEDGRFERLGSNVSRISSFRLVSASNRDFDALIKAGDFRRDFFYRLSAVTLRLPPLRDRRDDIPLLAEHLIAEFAGKNLVKPKHLSPAAMDYLQQLSWPGNVRQLKHALHSAFIFSDSDLITIDDFGVVWGDAPPLSAAAEREPLSASVPVAADGGGAAAGSLKDAVSAMEDKFIRDAMRRHAGNKMKVAAELGISRTNLYRRLALLGEGGSG